MKVECHVQKEPAQFLFLMVNGEPWKEIHRRLFLAHLPKLLRSNDFKELEERFKNIEERVAKEEAVSLLAARNYFSEKLRGKLKERKLSDSAIRSALEECKQRGYLDDQAETRRFIAREKKRGVGPHLIAMKLRSLGIAFEEGLMQEEESEMIRRLLQKKFACYCLNHPKDRQKVYLALKRRGFHSESIFRALDEKEFLSSG